MYIYAICDNYIRESAKSVVVTIFLTVAIATSETDCWHHENMSVQYIPPETPLLYRKTGMQGYTHFSYFCSKT